MSKKTDVEDEIRILHKATKQYPENKVMRNKLKKRVLLDDRPDNSIMKQCHNALCDALEDLLQLVHVRDAAINVCGKVRGDVDCVEYSAMAGRGVGSQFDDILNKDIQ